MNLLRGAGFPVETGNVRYERNSTQVLAKIDHQLAVNNNLSVRFNWADDLNDNIEPWGGIVAKSAGAFLDSRDFMVAGSHNAVWSSKTTDELRFQVAYRDQRVISFDPHATKAAIATTRADHPGNQWGGHGGASAIYTSTPRKRAVSDRGHGQSHRAAHQLKAGFDYSYIDHRNQALPLHFGGRFIFVPLPPFRVCCRTDLLDSGVRPRPAGCRTCRVRRSERAIWCQRPVALRTG